MTKLTSFLLSGVLLFSVGACTTSKTASDAPNTTENNGDVPAADEAETNQNDATSETRKKQIESDIRAREQRNDAGGDNAVRADGDLESEVRGKLEVNMPISELTVEAKEGAVTVSGTVQNQDQLDKIATLAKEIKGVRSVDVKATVAPAQSPGG